MFSRRRNFDRIQRGLNRHPVDPFVGQHAERLEYECFHLFGAARIDALKSEREHRLQELIIESATGNVLAQSGINQRLAHGRGRRPD